MQHRFAGTGELAGHSLGNLLITALWEETGDIVTGLDWVGALLGAHGRVLPVATVPLQVVADVARPAPGGRARPSSGSWARCRSPPRAARSSACTSSRPRRTPARRRVEAIREAEAIVLGPGSWFTSVLAPLLVPGVADAVARLGGPRRRGAQPERAAGGDQRLLARSATSRCSPPRFRRLRVDTVLADPTRVADVGPSPPPAPPLGGRLVLAPVAARDGTAAPRRRPARQRPRRHPHRLSRAAPLPPRRRGRVMRCGRLLTTVAGCASWR